MERSRQTCSTGHTHTHGEPPSHSQHCSVLTAANTQGCKTCWPDGAEPYTGVGGSDGGGVRERCFLSLPLQDEEEEFQSEAQSVSRKFQTLRDEVLRHYGYEHFVLGRKATANSTQDQFTAKTKMQCNSESHGCKC